MKNKEHIGVISGLELVTKTKGKLGKHDGIVHSGTGFHNDPKQYNRKNKKSQQLKTKLKDYTSNELPFFFRFWLFYKPYDA